MGGSSFPPPFNLPSMRMTSAELAKLQNTKRVAGTMTGLSTNGLTRAILLFLATQNVDASRTNTMGVFDIKKAAALLAGKQIHSAAEAEKLLRSCYRKSHEMKGKADEMKGKMGEMGK